MGQPREEPVANKPKSKIEWISKQWSDPFSKDQDPNEAQYNNLEIEDCNLPAEQVLEKYKKRLVDKDDTVFYDMFELIIVKLV